MARSWHERGQYANMIKDVLSTQMQCYKKEHDNLKKTKIAQSIGYLGQIVNSLISAQEEVSFQSKISDISDGYSINNLLNQFDHNCQENLRVHIHVQGDENPIV